MKHLAYLNEVKVKIVTVRKEAPRLDDTLCGEEIAWSSWLVRFASRPLELTDTQLRYGIRFTRRSHWPQGLRLRLAAARQLELRVQIPSRALMSAVSVVGFQVERSLRRADHSSRGVLPTVVRRCVWSINLKNREVMAWVGPQRHSRGSRVLVEKLTRSQLLKKFSTFYGTGRFITAFRSAWHASTLQPETELVLLVEYASLDALNHRSHCKVPNHTQPMSLYRLSYPGLSRGGTIEALRYKPEGRGFDSRWMSEFFIDNPSGCTMALGVTQLLTEMSTRNISWGVKMAGA
jgi:hypothetical protein